MKKLLLVVVALILFPGIVQGAVVAKEDFDGGAVGLVSSSVPALDGGTGDYFGVGSRNAWPQGFPPGVPFGIADDSVISYSEPGGVPFAGDTEGIFGQNSDLDNVYFAISDTREWGPALLVASWTFDISGYVDLALAVDIGGISNAENGGYTAAANFKFAVKVDGGPEQHLLDVTTIDYNGFALRPMDSGNASGGGRLFQVSGENGVTKLLAEDGSVAGNTYVDKSVPSGPRAGLLDTFKAPVTGTGSQLEVIMTADLWYEAAAFDNIVIEGDVSTATKNSTWGRLKSLYR